MAVSLNKLAQAVNDYDAIKTKRLEADKVAAKLKEEETRLKNFLMDNISKSDSMGVCGKTRRATIVTKTEPTPEDWGKLFAYIKKNNAFDLLQRRLSPPAVRARWDDDKEVPGVGKIIVLDLSLTKL